MRNFASPSRYIQGENALFENEQSISELGTHPVLLCDSVVYDIVGKRFEEIPWSKWAHGFASLL